jgi:pilus assembly protein CpaC
MQKKSVSGLLFLLLFLLPASAMSRDSITLYMGEVKVLEMGKVERVAIGNPTVASNSILPNGQLVILADKLGITTVHLWLEDKTEKDFEIIVKKKAILDNYQELSTLLHNISGVSSIKVGSLIVVKGAVPTANRAIYNKIMARYKGEDVLDLVENKSVSGDIAKLLTSFPNVNVQQIDGKTVITGETSKEYGDLLKILESKYPSILNLTRVQDAVAGKMVYMKVRIMEVNKSITENLGINWQNIGILGPSLEFGVEVSNNGSTILNAEGTPKSLTKSGNSNLNTASGFFGIATGISSTLDLAETRGDAVTLAEPQLSARSGGKAQFLSGGEFPMPVTSAQGQVTVEFKKWGIMLNIAPIVDSHDNILAHIETEVSSIDFSVQVNHIPGLKSRKTYTDISIRSHETLVISGLLTEDAEKDYDNVKWLSDIPVLGSLFRSKQFKNKRSELIIFVTPYIYDVGSSENKQGLAKVKKMEKAFQKIIQGKELME